MYVFGRSCYHFNEEIAGKKRKKMSQREFNPMLTLKGGVPKALFKASPYGGLNEPIF